MNANLQVEIQTRLQQAQVNTEQAQWQEAILACQQVIEYCRSQLSAISVETSPEAYLRHGDQALEQGDLDRALAQYDLALKLNPNSPQIYQKLGDSLAKKGQWQQATTYYRQSIKLKKSSAATLEEQSRSLKTLNREQISQSDLENKNTVVSQGENNSQIKSKTNIAAKIEHYLQEVTNSPNSIKSLANLADLYTQQQQWQQAIAIYEQALKINPNLAIVRRNLAVVAEKNGQLELAADSWYQALQLEPNWATAANYLKLGNILVKQEKYESAISCYLQAIALEPDLTKAYIGLGNVFERFKQPARALSILQELIEQYPNSAAVYLYQGRILTLQTELAAAKAAYQQAVKIDPQLWQGYYYWAEIAKKGEQWQEVATIYHQAVCANQDLFLVHYNLGYAHFRLQNWSESIAALRKAIELNPNYPLSYVHLGIIDTIHQKWQEAIANLLQAIALKSDLVGVYQHLGCALHQYSQNIDDVETTTDKVEALLPFKSQDRTATLYCQLAANLSHQKQYDGAIVFYNLALRLQPGDSQIAQGLQEATEQQHQLQLDIIDCQQQILTHPDRDWKYVELGNLFADLGNFETAVKLHRQGSILRGWDLAATRNYQFQYDWFTHNIPVWQTQLQALIDQPIKILEIGSYEGMATCWFLDYVLTHPEAKITCIDIYFQNNFARNIAQTQAADKVMQICANSQQILPSLSPNTYDILYIDGSHLADDVEQDALLSWNLLKVGGVVIFDDYALTTPDLPEQDTQIGIDRFLATISNCYQILHQNYQLIIKKTV